MSYHKDLPQFPESYWTATQEERPKCPKLTQDSEADVVVVGGGISGITTAYLLSQEGLRVVLVEAGEILNGTTAHTTAKITAQHDLIFDELIRSEGKEKARLYYQAAKDAMSFIEQTIEKHQIECGYAKQDAYVYTHHVDYIVKVENEAKAYQELGIPGAYLDRMPLQLPLFGAVRMDGQAQFHPLNYLLKLVREFQKLGGRIYEHTTAVDVEQVDTPKVMTSDGHRITCKYVVSCTHFPFYDGMGFYFARMHADRSYVLGLRVEDEYPGGMYLSAEDPKRSIRYAPLDDQNKLIILGGQSHKTGQGICTINHYEELRKFAENQFKLKEIAYRWSAQDLATADKLPFIGRITASASNVWIATGFRKWGMTNGTAAALLIRDLILERENPYEGLFSPSRSVSWKTVGKLIADNADVAKHLIAGKLEYVKKRPEQLEKDEGSVVQIHGRRAGGYRDKDGRLFLVDTTCTHMGCEVEWNNGERTWDCPCHGSRFSITGDVIDGPAEKPLVRL
ncbi:FAD-dependent oxidoreductase [Paenibacillus glycanilyticus]|uniref:FAD-dependent oxidoreductase n=1 Tax=Paenibacillus glycanilyticus TaxID=126569 RepID=UPI00203E2CD5|nr:FAD-dependent oxidoreductase [Paenibacillus glycanilyticus]MCM3628533.1 FAD-dependent oxidoreductase [Paenibacillus glycanilyticus]